MNREMEAVEVNLTILLGQAHLPVQQLLRMGRGAVVMLDSTQNDKVWVLANEHPIARGELLADEERIRIQITDTAHPQDYFSKARTGGSS